MGRLVRIEAKNWTYCIVWWKSILSGSQNKLDKSCILCGQQILVLISTFCTSGREASTTGEVWDASQNQADTRSMDSWVGASHSCPQAQEGGDQEEVWERSGRVVCLMVLLLFLTPWDSVLINFDIGEDLSLRGMIAFCGRIREFQSCLVSYSKKQFCVW